VKTLLPYFSGGNNNLLLIFCLTDKIFQVPVPKSEVVRIDGVGQLFTRAVEQLIFLIALLMCLIILVTH